MLKITRWLMLGIIAAVHVAAMAGDREDATKAARDIMRSLRERQYEKLWSSQTSDYFKSKTTKDQFLSNLSIGRQQLGVPGELKLIEVTYAQSDAATGYKGDIYAATFLSGYSVGNFYERIVMVKEADGGFRLSGLWGSPAPANSK